MPNELIEEDVMGEDPAEKNLAVAPIPDPPPQKGVDVKALTDRWEKFNTERERAKEERYARKSVYDNLPAERQDDLLKFLQPVDRGEKSSDKSGEFLPKHLRPDISSEMALKQQPSATLKRAYYRNLGKWHVAMGYSANDRLGAIAAESEIFTIPKDVKDQAMAMAKKEIVAKEAVTVRHEEEFGGPVGGFVAEGLGLGAFGQEQSEHMAWNPDRFGLESDVLEAERRVKEGTHTGERLPLSTVRMILDDPDKALDDGVANQKTIDAILEKYKGKQRTIEFGEDEVDAIVGDPKAALPAPDDTEFPGIDANDPDMIAAAQEATREEEDISRMQGKTPEEKEIDLDRGYKKNLQTLLDLNDEMASIRKRETDLEGERALSQQEWNAKRKKHLDEQRLEDEWYQELLQDEMVQHERKKSEADEIGEKLLDALGDSRKISGWDIFRKSALAVSSVVAAAATVFGQAAFAKKGVTMPNVLMPLVMKAINADIYAAQAEQKEFVDRAGVYINYADHLRKIYKDETDQLAFMRQHAYKYWERLLSKESHEIDENSKRTLLELKDAIRKKSIAEESAWVAQSQQRIDKTITEQLNAVNMGEVVEISRSNREKMLLDSIKLQKELSVPDSWRLDELAVEDRKKTTSSLKTLDDIAPLKSRLLEMFGNATMSGFLKDTNVGELKKLAFSDFLAKYIKHYGAGKTKLLAANLEMLSRKYAIRIEGRGLTEGEAQFYDDSLMIALKTGSILTVLSALSQLQYAEKYNVLSQLGTLSDKGRKKWVERVEHVTRQEFGPLMERFSASIRNNIGKTAEDIGVIDVGVVPTNLEGRWQKGTTDYEILDKVANRWVTEIVSPDSTNRADKPSIKQIERNFADSDPNEIVEVPTRQDGVMARMPRRFYERWLAFCVFSKAVDPELTGNKKDPIERWITGGRSGFRTEDDVKALEKMRKDGKLPDLPGGKKAVVSKTSIHKTGHGLDVSLGGFGTKKYKHFIKYAHLFGLKKAHDDPGGKYPASHHWGFVEEEELTSKFWKTQGKHLLERIRKEYRTNQERARNKIPVDKFIAMMKRQGLVNTDNARLAQRDASQTPFFKGLGSWSPSMATMGVSNEELRAARQRVAERNWNALLPESHTVKNY